MTPKEAISLLDRAVATISTDRNTHIKLQEALLMLEKLIKKDDSGKVTNNKLLPK